MIKLELKSPPPTFFQASHATEPMIETDFLKFSKPKKALTFHYKKYFPEFREDSMR